MKIFVIYLIFASIGLYSAPVQKQQMFESKIAEVAAIAEKPGILDKNKAIKQYEEEVIENRHQNSAIPPKDNSILRIMTYNVHFFRDSYDKKDTVREALAVIKNINPDIVLLQEASAVPGFGKKGPFIGSEPYTLLEKNFSSIFTCNTLSDPLWFGNVLASKFPLNAKGKLFDRQIVKGGFEQRCFIETTIHTNGVDLGIFNTHLEVRGADELREQQMQEIIKAVHGSAITNQLIAGDFNATRDSVVIKSLENAKYKDCFSYLGWKNPSFTNWTGKEIDFIFLSPGWNLPLAGCYIYYDVASDHLPLIMDIQLKTAESKDIAKDLVDLNSFFSGLARFI